MLSCKTSGLMLLVLLAVFAAGCSKAPDAPLDLQATAVNGCASLTWLASPGASSYKVYQGATSGGPFENIVTVTETAHTVTGLTNGTPYYFVVTACNEKGESLYSNEISVTPENNDPPSITASSPADHQYIARTFSGGLATTQLTFTVTANDPDGDTLDYDWACSSGTGTPTNSPSFTWTLPVCGSYDNPQVSVTVSDGHNPAVNRTWFIEVLDPTQIYFCTRYSTTPVLPPTGGKMTAGVHFPSALLVSHLNRKIKNVNVYAAGGINIPVIVKVCPNLNGAPGVPLYSWSANLGAGFNNLLLPGAATIAIGTTTDLWVLVEMTHSAETPYYLACCPGPAASDGNWIKLNDEAWTHLNQVNTSYAGNWIIRLVTEP